MESKPRDTGGEFSGPLPLVVLVTAERPRMVAEASPPAADAHEQMANSEFATSIPRYRVAAPQQCRTCALSAASNIGNKRPAVRQGSFDGHPWLPINMVRR